jgi:TetR/AcrR family transcriptional regulator, repressor for uid operon
VTQIGDQRRREVLLAAGGCFARKGFHQTSIADICASAGMSTGSLYRYFRSKDDIIRAMVEDERRGSAALVESLAKQADFVAALEATFAEVLVSFADAGTNAMHAEVTAEALRNPDIATLVRASDEAIRTALTDVIRQAQHAKVIDGSLAPEVVAELLIALFDGLWWRQAMQPDADPQRHMPTLAVLLRRLLTPGQSESIQTSQEN